MGTVAYRWSCVRAQAVRTVHARRQGAVGNRPTRLQNLCNHIPLLPRCRVDTIVGLAHDAVVRRVQTQYLSERAVISWSEAAVSKVHTLLLYSRISSRILASRQLNRTVDTHLQSAGEVCIIRQLWLFAALEYFVNRLCVLAGAACSV